MGYDEQDALIEELSESIRVDGKVTDDGVKTLFVKKNELNDSVEGTSYEFDEFFAESICEWVGDNLDDAKADFLLELIDSKDGSADDAEDALLEVISEAVDLEETVVCDKFKEHFEGYF